MDPRRLASVFAVPTALLLLVGCASVQETPEVSTMPPPESTVDRDVAKAFHDLAERFVQEYYAFRPTWATYIGIHDHDGRLDDWSPEAIQTEVERLRSVKEKLGEIEIEELGDADRIDLEILSSRVEAELYSFTEIRAFETNPIDYNDILSYSIDNLVNKEFAPKADRLRRIVERESQFPRFLEQARKNLKNPPRVFTRKAMELVDGTLTFLRETLPKAFADVEDDALMEAFRNENDQAIREVQLFRDFLQEDLLPRSTGEFALGPERFHRQLFLREMIGLSLEELREIGDKALQSTRNHFIETAGLIDPEADPREVFASLKEDHATAEELFSSTEKSLEGMRQFLVDQEIVTLPSEERCKVVPMPPFMWGFAAMNSPGPLEKVATEAYYYVDPVEDDWTEEKKEEHLRNFNRATMEIISIHEAYPGHYVQGLYSQEVPSLVRKVFWSYAYGEGWAHYCEQMLIDEGYGGGDPRLRLAQLSDALIRLCRYRAALGLHTEGWTVDQAQKFFQEEGFQDAYTARRESIRGTFDPLYLSYTLGKLLILQLREEYSEKMGDDYTLRGFHDRLLSVGSVPIPIARKVLLGVEAPTDP